VRFEDYEKRFEHVALERTDGVLTVRLHSDDGPLYWNEQIHRELPELFHALSTDLENRVVLITGTGDGFCAGTAPGNFGYSSDLPPVHLDAVYREGRAMLKALVDIPVPVITAVNGPAISHPELALLGDIVLASDTAVFQDRHFSRGIVPGDGIHIVFPLVFGITRGRYLALTCAEVSAAQAHEWGAVNELLPPAELLPRARALAADLATRSILGLRYTRELLNLEISRLISSNLGHGLALEGFASGYGAWDGALHAPRS
jgi:enoyl-CoA hydratase/carnithine racemase